MAILTRDKLFIFHLALSMVTFTMVLSSTVSDNWSTHKHGFHGVFKQCHLVHACNNRIQKTGNIILFIILNLWYPLKQCLHTITQSWLCKEGDKDKWTNLLYCHFFNKQPFIQRMTNVCLDVALNSWQISLAFSFFKGLYRGLQLGLVLSCISLLLVVVYSFISLLLRQYLYNRVYVVAAFYAIPGITYDT